MGCRCFKTPNIEEDNLKLQNKDDGGVGHAETCVDHTNHDEEKKPEVKQEDLPENRETNASHLDVPQKPIVDESAMDKSNVSGKGGKKKAKKSIIVSKQFRYC